MAEKHTVAMFVQGEDGKRVQVGWASPKNADGVRTFEYSPGYEETRPKDVSFEDDELSQKIAEEQHEARTGDGNDGEEFEIDVEDARTLNPVVNDEAPQPAEPVVAAPDEEKAAEPITEAPDPELADDPTDAGVEEADEDEEAEFERLLAEEEAEKNQEQPQTRRELRENEEN